MLAGNGRIYRFSATGGSLGFESFVEPLQYTLGAPIPTTTLPAARGGSGSFTYSLSPSLPAGLSFDASTRILQGTATVLADTTTYTLHAVDTNGLQGTLQFELSVHESLSNELTDVLPGFILHGHFPSPSSGDTRIVFDLPERASVSIELHDLLGRRITTVPPQIMAPAIQQSVLVPTSTLPGGVYLYRVIVTKQNALLTAHGKLLVQ